MNFRANAARGSTLLIAVVGLVVGYATPTLARDTRSPSVPTGLTTSVTGCGQVTLRWNAAYDNSGGSGLHGYQLARNGVLTKSIAAPYTYAIDSGLAATTYQYKIRSVDNAGNVSAWSSNVNVAVPACTATRTALVTFATCFFTWATRTAPPARCAAFTTR